MHVPESFDGKNRAQWYAFHFNDDGHPPIKRCVTAASIAVHIHNEENHKTTRRRATRRMGWIRVFAFVERKCNDYTRSKGNCRIPWHVAHQIPRSHSKLPFVQRHCAEGLFTLISIAENFRLILLLLFVSFFVANGLPEWRMRDIVASTVLQQLCRKAKEVSSLQIKLGIGRSKWNFVKRFKK